MKMDLMTLFGGIIGLGVIFFVLNAGGMLRFLLNWEAIVLIFGGTLGSVMIAYPWASLQWTKSSFMMVLFPPKRPPISELIRSLVSLAEIGRSEEHTSELQS